MVPGGQHPKGDKEDEEVNNVENARHDLKPWHHPKEPHVNDSAEDDHGSDDHEGSPAGCDEGRRVHGDDCFKNDDIAVEDTGKTSNVSAPSGPSL